VENRTRLDAFGVKSLSLFGSVARNEATLGNDLDLLIEFDGQVALDRFMNTKFFLEDLLEVKVDLVMPDALHAQRF